MGRSNRRGDAKRGTSSANEERDRETISIVNELLIQTPVGECCVCKWICLLPKSRQSSSSASPLAICSADLLQIPTVQLRQIAAVRGLVNSQVCDAG